MFEDNIKLFNLYVQQSNSLPADSPESESRVFDLFVDFYLKYNWRK